MRWGFEENQTSFQIDRIGFLLGVKVDNFLNLWNSLLFLAETQKGEKVWIEGNLDFEEWTQKGKKLTQIIFLLGN